METELKLTRKARTYRLQAATVAKLATLAAESQIGVSDLVQALLTHTLAEIEAGRIVLDVRPVSWGVFGVIHPA